MAKSNNHDIYRGLKETWNSKKFVPPLSSDSFRFNIGEISTIHITASNGEPNDDCDYDSDKP